MKINKLGYLGVMLLINACNMDAAAALAPLLEGVMGSSLPKMTFNLTIDTKTQKVNQTCYGKIENSVTNYTGGTVQVVNGNCTQGSSQSMGKYGDMTIIPTAQLTVAKNFGNVSALEQQEFYLPKSSSVQNNVIGWDNALLFKFKPSNPLPNSKWVSSTVNPLRGREYQVIVRLVTLTQALAQSTGQLEAFNSVNNPTLIEVWTQVSPSVSGSKAAKEVFDLVVDGSTINSQAPLLFLASPDGRAAITYAVVDQADNQQKIASTEFNVGEEAP